QGAPDYAAIVAAPDRSEADRTTDKRRDPVKLLAFTGVRTGMTVLDMGAGGGYSTELMARAVGPTGKVYGQNAANFERAVTALQARTQTPAGKNITPLAPLFGAAGHAHPSPGRRVRAEVLEAALKKSLCCVGQRGPANACGRRPGNP